MRIEFNNSSMLSSATYDEAEQSLTIEFSKGGEYKYADVPKEIFDALKNAESAGKYFLANIKNKFECEKV